MAFGSGTGLWCRLCGHAWVPPVGLELADAVAAAVAECLRAGA
jgi:hypothetical protein